MKRRLLYICATILCVMFVEHIVVPEIQDRYEKRWFWGQEHKDQHKPHYLLYKKGKVRQYWEFDYRPSCNAGGFYYVVKDQDGFELKLSSSHCIVRLQEDYIVPKYFVRGDE